MMTPTPIDQTSFKRILNRNIKLPLAIGIFSILIFVGMILYLLSVMGWVEHTEKVIADINSTSKLSLNLANGSRGFLVTGDESFLSPYEIDKPQIDHQLTALEGLVDDNPAQVERLKRIQNLQHDWENFAQKVIEMRRANQDYQSETRNGRGNALFTQIQREYDDAVGMERNLLAERNQNARQAIWIVIGSYLALTIGLSILIAAMGRRDLLHLSSVYNTTMEKQNAHAGFLQDQAWLKTGQTELADGVIGQLSPSMVGDKILAFLAAYLDAAVAVCYVREERGALQRVAFYGVAHDNGIDQPGAAEQSLVGQVVRNNRLMVLREVPADYLKLVSSLGSCTPQSIVLLPFSNEGKVNGVLELGFMRPVVQRDIDFLELIDETIGTSIGAALYRQRLQDVLAETQQLNEELQVQQEELRTANEELEEQSRVLEESQISLENQKAELEQTNDQLADQAIALDRKNADLKTAQIELEKHSDDLQRASRYKSEFLANMSHELRTPLNSSLILAKLLSENKKGNLDDEQIRFAQAIYSAGNDLLNLINDILDISKVEAGKLELNPEEIRLSKLVEDIGTTFRPLAQQKNLAFSVELDYPNGAMVTDPVRLDQILKNLLSNAVKFTESGAVTLKITADAKNMVNFAVTDSGIGIAPEHHETVFEAFQQADGTISRKYGGTGLGLSISRDLAKLLGGTIKICSTPGKGSTFTLTLPEQWSGNAAGTSPHGASSSTAAQPNVAPPQSNTPATALPAAPVNTRSAVAFPDDRNAEPSRDRTILLIEDDSAFAAILFDLAHEMHFRCLVALTAEEGIRLANEHTPDAILLDMRLPDQSGLTVLQQLKENSALRHIPVHVVSALERSDAALQMGAIGYANKPVTREQLKDVFLKLEEKFMQKIKRVLVVEDDARQRDSVIKLLNDVSVEITAVALGEEALQLLRTTVFDCMIIDLKLPDIQGHELLQRMTAERLSSFPPVIVYTGRNLSREEEAELMKYSRSIILKGARSPERLLDEVTLFLHKVESQLPSAAQNMLKTVRSRDRIFEGRKVLLVDDDVRNIFALTSALEHKGIAIQIGRNGYEAISKLDEVPDIDLVLMDVMMPGMDGLEATRRIRKDARFQKLPIIAVTAKAMKDDQEQCLAAGATDYLAKPIDLERLYALLRIWMPHLERHAD